MGYEKFSREELIGLIVQLQAKITKLEEQLQSTHKDSSNSSKPPSSDFPKRNRSLREKSGFRPGGQAGHMGITRPLTDAADTIVDCRPETCAGCGESLINSEGEIYGKEQVIDIPPIVPVVTEYNQIRVTCSCGVKNIGVLPHEASGVMRIGENIRSFVSYLNVTHHIPYDRLTILVSDILNVTVSEGTIGTILKKTAEQGEWLYGKIKAMVNTGSYRGSDETGVRVMGKTWWEWVWQNTKASYYVIDKFRGYGVVEGQMPGQYHGVHIADCWSAQNNTKANKHQLCIKHKDKILTFMNYRDVPPDNNSSEQAIRQSKVKMKVSGGFRSEQGARTYAILLSIIETCKKQHMNILQAIQDILRGIDISTQFTT